MKKVTKPSSAKIASEDRVRNAVVGFIAQNGYSKGLEIKSGDQHGVDIYAMHVKNAARRIYIETKGSTPGGNKHLSILNAWGQLLCRITSLNNNRIHGLAFPKEWEDNVAKLSSHIVAKKLNVRYYFVNSRGDVEEYTAEQFRQKHPKKKK